MNDPTPPASQTATPRTPSLHELRQLDAAFAALQTIEKACGHKSQGMAPMPWESYIRFVVEQVSGQSARLASLTAELRKRDEADDASADKWGDLQHDMAALRERCEGYSQAWGVHVARIEALEADNQRLARERLQWAIQAVTDEEELPGDMPDAMWEAIRGDREATQIALRTTVQETKKGIIARLSARSAQGGGGEST